MQASWRGRELRLTQDNTGKIRDGDILLFSILRNEAFRIPHFLSHYRELGVDHFLLVDNDSSDDFAQSISSHPDVSVWHTKGSYRRAAFGVHWLNCLLRRYGTGHWCVTVDPDELMVYPFCNTRNLRELTTYLNSQKRRSMYFILLDMYGERAVAETHCLPGQNPLLVAPYFDKSGYVQRINGTTGEVFVQGGPRRRTLFRSQPRNAPSLNKTALVNWSWPYAYLSSTHTLTIKALNRPNRGALVMPSGCLMHFKFLSSLAEKTAEELVRRQHFADSREYRAYATLLSDVEEGLVCECSVKYSGPDQLIDLGLMQRGDWF